MSCMNSKRWAVTRVVFVIILICILYATLTKVPRYYQGDGKEGLGSRAEVGLVLDSAQKEALLARKHSLHRAKYWQKALRIKLNQYTTVTENGENQGLIKTDVLSQEPKEIIDINSNPEHSGKGNAPLVTKNMDVKTTSTAFVVLGGRSTAPSLQQSSITQNPIFSVAFRQTLEKSRPAKDLRLVLIFGLREFPYINKKQKNQN